MYHAEMNTWTKLIQTLQGLVSLASLPCSFLSNGYNTSTNPTALWRHASPAPVELGLVDRQYHLIGQTLNGMDMWHDGGESWMNMATHHFSYIFHSFRIVVYVFLLQYLSQFVPPSSGILFMNLSHILITFFGKMNFHDLFPYLQFYPSNFHPQKLHSTPQPRFFGWDPLTLLNAATDIHLNWPSPNRFTGPCGWIGWKLDEFFLGQVIHFSTAPGINIIKWIVI